MSGLIYFQGFAGFPVSGDSEVINAGEPVRLLPDGTVTLFEADTTATSDFAIGLAVESSNSKSQITVALPSSLVVSCSLNAGVLPGDVVEYDSVAREWVVLGNSTSQVVGNILCFALDAGGTEGRIVILSAIYTAI